MGVDELFAAAEAKIERLGPEAASGACAAGAVIIDTRMHSDREKYGVVPGSIHIPRTLLEWRVSPGSEWTNPYLVDLNRQLIVMCNQGYSSVLAAANLVDIGYARAADLRGGFHAWVEAGLPTMPPPERDEEAIEGMGGPEHKERP